MSDTPRTDAWEMERWRAEERGSIAPPDPWQRCRELEREVNFWRKNHDAWETQAMNALTKLSTLSESAPSYEDGLEAAARACDAYIDACTSDKDCSAVNDLRAEIRALKNAAPPPELSNRVKSASPDEAAVAASAVTETNDTELMGGGSASLNGWPGNQGTAPKGVQECRENSGAADGGERPASINGGSLRAHQCVGADGASPSGLPPSPVSASASGAPRTDALLAENHYGWGDVDSARKGHIDAIALARQLERELAMVRETLRRSDAENDELRELEAARSSTVPTSDAVRSALIDLVALKDLKEWIEDGVPGVTDTERAEVIARYQREKEPAWEAARKALEAPVSASGESTPLAEKCGVYDNALRDIDIIVTSKRVSPRETVGYFRKRFEQIADIIARATADRRG